MQGTGRSEQHWKLGIGEWVPIFRVFGNSYTYLGNSYTKYTLKLCACEVHKKIFRCAVARENTLHSLNSAAKHGADFVCIIS